AGQPVAAVAGETTKSAWLGIEPLDVTAAMARQLGLDISGGILVSRVISGSPAEKAGILQGDVIYEIDSRDVVNSAELRLVLADEEPGDRVRITLFREREREVIYVKLGSVSDQNSAYSATQIDGDIPVNLRWGLVVSELTPSLIKTYNINNPAGVMVVMVAPGSAADRAGILKGDLIRQVNGHVTNNLADFFDAIEEAKENILLNICRQGALYYVNIVAVSPPVLNVGGATSDDVDASTTDSDGLQGMPAVIPPRGKPTASVQQSAGMVTAQEGIGMNRPLYVPGYDQTQSGDPQDKTTSATQSTLKTGTGSSTGLVL
ncbi:MAG TPA: PDZ domain-containing protein, partial [Deltaproteobacteria bacterium]|nr:PDZ domain-containing protein [Deltaproteobacteria bacterium]